MSFAVCHFEFDNIADRSNLRSESPQRKNSRPTSIHLPHGSMTVAVCRVCQSRHVGFDSGNAGIHHAREFDQPSSKAPSRAVVQFFVPAVSAANAIRFGV